MPKVSPSLEVDMVLGVDMVLEVDMALGVDMVVSEVFAGKNALVRR
jgi:hypothetical protein